MTILRAIFLPIAIIILGFCVSIFTINALAATFAYGNLIVGCMMAGYAIVFGTVLRFLVVALLALVKESIVEEKVPAKVKK